MKVIIFALLILSALSLQIKVPSFVSMTDTDNQIQLSSVENSGDVGYRIQGLPAGFVINNNKIIYTGKDRINGQFPATIIAIDEKGDIARLVIIINANLTGLQELNRLIQNANNQNAQLIRINRIQNRETSSTGDSGFLTSTTRTQEALPQVKLISQNPSQSSTSTTSTGNSGFLSSSSINQGQLPNLQLISGLRTDFNQGAGLRTSSSSSSSFSSNIATSSSGINTNIASSSGNANIDTNELITRYNNGLLNNVLQSKKITSYPVPTVIVTGNLPNQTPNTQVITVTSSQADRTNSGVKSLSQYDLNITSLFNQQTQIGHTIGNLLQIIRQGSMNRKKIQVDIDTLTKKLNSQVLIQQDFALAISTEQSKIKNIQTAIVNANDSLNKLNGNLNTVNEQITLAKRKGLQLTQNLSIALNNQDGLKGQISGAKETITRLTLNIKSSTQVCDDANSAIFRLNGNISSLKASIAGVDQRVSGIDKQISDYQKQIAALQAQINALNGKISNAKTDRQALINLNFTVPQQIANLNAQILFQQQRCNNAGGNQADLKIVQENLADFEKKLRDNNNQVSFISSEINLIKSNLNDLINRNSSLHGQIAVIQSNINTLRLQLPGLQNNLNKLYLQANRGLQIITSTNQTLAAAVIRFKRESDSLAIANLNLQQARAQQQKIRQSINLIVQQNTAGLPFPSAPLTTGINSTIVSINSIDSISLYLLNAYGSTFEFENYYRQFLSVSKLYRFGAYNSLMSNCAISKEKDGRKLLSAQGKILQINDKYIKVNNIEGDQTLNLDGCSVQLANINDYHYNIGDIIVWKGYYDMVQRTWDVAQLTCFA